MNELNRRDALKRAVAGAVLTGVVGAAPIDQRPKKYLILACDGGGMRGLLTALIIERLEKETGFLSEVNLFAGTSTGGIIALGLANGVTPGRLVALYADRGREIFRRSEAEPDPSGRIGKLLDKFRKYGLDLIEQFGFGVKDLLRAKYHNGGLKKVLEESLGGATTFADLKPGRSALVTTLRLSAEGKGWVPLVLHNLDVGGAAGQTRLEDGPSPKTLLVDAALGTSAAPLYFPPYDLPGYGYCVDGGLFANCPSSVALATATRAIRASGAERPPIRVLSIGTGAQINGIEVNDPPFDRPEEYGAVAWLDPMPRGKGVNGSERTPAFPLISALFDAGSAAHNYICKETLGEDYYRVQVDLKQPVALDETGEEAVRRIRDAVDGLFNDKPAWGTVTEWIKRQIA
jgi:predicted acylesterase/phospholipase RssA